MLRATIRMKDFNKALAEAAASISLSGVLSSFLKLLSHWCCW